MAKKKKQVTKKDSPLYWIIFSVIVVALLIVAFFKLGLVGTILANCFAFLIGDYYWLSLLMLLIMAFYVIYAKYKKITYLKTTIGIILLVFAIIILQANLLSFNIDSFNAYGSYFLQASMDVFSLTSHSFGGGIIGNLLYMLSAVLFGGFGSYVVIAVLIVIALILLVPTEVYKRLLLDVSDSISKPKPLKTNKHQSFSNIELNHEETKDDRKSSIFIEADLNEPIKEEVKPKFNIPIIKPQTSVLETIKTPVLSNEVAIETINDGEYKMPPLSLLDNVLAKGSSVNKTSADIKGKKVIEILRNFGIEAVLIQTHVGPSVTKFEIKPDSSVKVSKIQNISDNIKMELAARDIRIEAPIPGRNAVGIEIPNVEPTMVRMYELMRQMMVNKAKSPLLFALGKDLLGQNVYCELDKMPHLLIAGATGSGKSVCINTIITSLLMHSHPDDVRLVLIDPKKVEFTPYHDVPHLLWPVITDATMASNMLKRVVVLMEERYETFAEVGVRNIKNYNALVEEHNANLKAEDKPMNKMPYMVVIIDELADLMAIAGKEVEMSIQRITQLARASGIHLIVATQRPSTDVITGIIKSNIPSRISFAVASSIDSRTILDQTGAERLLGNGDMLYAPQGENSPTRIQGVYVTDQEIKKTSDFIKKEKKPVYEDSYFEFLNIANNSGGSVLQAAKEEDDLMNDVIEYVTEVQKASTSLLQRRFGIGYNRAARIIENLEDRGIIGPAQGSKPREVYLKKEEES